MSAKIDEFNRQWARRQRWAYVRAALFLLVIVGALGLGVVFVVTADARGWTRCDHGVECVGTRCRCVR